MSLGSIKPIVELISSLLCGKFILKSGKSLSPAPQKYVRMETVKVVMVTVKNGRVEIYFIHYHWSTLTPDSLPNALH